MLPMKLKQYNKTEEVIIITIMKKIVLGPAGLILIFQWRITQLAQD